MDYEQTVARHYARSGLVEQILQALSAAGQDIAALTPADLAPVDEFHIGGRQATMNLAAQLDLNSGQHLLDIGVDRQMPGGVDRRRHGQNKAGADDQNRPAAGEFDDMGDDGGDHAFLGVSTFTKILLG